MKLFNCILIAFSAAASVGAASLGRRDVPLALVPQFGVPTGYNPDGHGNYDGAFGDDGTPVRIPCTCPPPRDVFIQALNENVNAGFIVNNTGYPARFSPTGLSREVQMERIVTLVQTLQNMYGRGVGCPVESTNFYTIQKYIDIEPLF
ncbi:hypothetical protein C8Q80DRAFT_1096890 [Daedaleopsis nitida]|nr:hypothetical protein C8Q80DRAFT_1096890 [Daedaleopsis nitida]